MGSPSTSDFAALARSSPWRWSTLRFTARWQGDPWRTQELRAWLRRPDRLRVETVGGTLEQVVHESPQQIGVLTSDGDRYTATLPWSTDPDAPRPLLRADGLVSTRPDGRFSSRICYDAPMYRDYFWVAMLDPVELTDGHDPDTGAALPGTQIDTVADVEHAGRPAWQAVLRPTPAYQPRCTCCSLLRSRVVDVAEAEAGAGNKVVLDEYPQAYRVRLDLATGVCVLTEHIGGSTAGSGHALRIEAVDEPMADDLFQVPPPSGPAP
ncbi:MAG: hypothetical protein L0K86_13635 [Actinomycetia bacterium]|nr:hypothetical protein [Actinomycetes bacterium]